MQDLEMTKAAFESLRPDNVFNMTVGDARRVGSVIGSDFYIVVRSGTQKRAALEKADYFEAFVSLFAISSRTGRLADWRLLSQKAATENEAENTLTKSLPPTAIEILKGLRSAANDEAREATPPVLEEPPDPTSPAARNYRPPVPYRRVKPEYTRTAYLYDITATIEITVDLDDKGHISHTEITRWAGYGLDENVRRTVTTMNWRPAERDGKPLPTRFLLRYNFKKVEEDEPDNE